MHSAASRLVTISSLIEKASIETKTDKRAKRQGIKESVASFGDLRENSTKNHTAMKELNRLTI